MILERRYRAVGTCIVALGALVVAACSPGPSVPPPNAPQVDVLVADAALVNPAISADGNWVAFASGASDLDETVSAGHTDVFLLHRTTGAVTRITAGDEASGTNSPDGGSPPDEPRSASDHRSIVVSSDGRFVAFASYADNLTADGGTPVTRDVFRWDRQTGTTIRTSRISPPAPCIGAPSSFPQGYIDSRLSMSLDGGTIVWSEYCTGGLGGTSIWRAATGTTSTSVVGANGTIRPMLSGDGSVVVATEFDPLAGGVGGSILRIDASTGTLISEVPAPTGTQVSGVDETGSAAVVSGGYGPVSRVDLATGAGVALTGPGTTPDVNVVGRALSAVAVSPDLGTVVVMSRQPGQPSNVSLDRYSATTSGPTRLQSGSFTYNGATAPVWFTGTPFDPPSSVLDDGQTVLSVTPDPAAPSKIVSQ